MMRYTFVWYGDGFWVYDYGFYIGRDEQLDLIEMLAKSGVIETKQPCESFWENDPDAPRNLSDFDRLERWEGY